MDVTKEHETILKNLADTMLGIARESVSMVKRSDQDVSTRLNREQEWEIYLEFLKVMFNLADRVSAFYIPLQQQPQFMDNLEDHVSDRLTTLIAPSMSSSEVDDQKVMLSVGQAVADSRRIYEKYKFVYSEDTKARNAFFQHAAERVAGSAGSSNNQAIISASTFCTRAVIPAMTALFEGKTGQENSESAPSQTEASPTSPDTTTSRPGTSEPSTPGPQAIKLISVISSISGEAFETRRGLFPQFRQDLRPEHVKELTTHMNWVAQILGDRFAVLSSKVSEESNQPSGNA